MRPAKNVPATAGHAPYHRRMGDADLTAYSDDSTLLSPASAPDRAVGATVRLTPAMPHRKPGPRPGSAQAKNGGLAVRERYGSDFYRRIGQKGGTTVRDRRGTQYFASIGQRGGRATSQRLGSEHFKRLGRQRGEQANR